MERAVILTGRATAAIRKSNPYRVKHMVPVGQYYFGSIPGRVR